MTEHTDIASVEEVELLLLTLPEVLHDAYEAQKLFDPAVLGAFGDIPWYSRHGEKNGSIALRRRVLRLRACREAVEYARNLLAQQAMQCVTYYARTAPPVMSDAEETWRDWAKKERALLGATDEKDWRDLLRDILCNGIHHITQINTIWCVAATRGDGNPDRVYIEYVEAILEHFGV